MQAREYADRMSVNIEAPNQGRLAELTSIKDYKNDIIKRQKWIKKINPRSGQTTQMIIGASDESDLEILDTSRYEYDKLGLAEVYYSGFTPFENTPLSDRPSESVSRENRLYKADRLLRDYNINLNQIEDIMDNGFLPKGDPKIHIADTIIDAPVDVNEAEFEELINVPGIGHTDHDPEGA